MAKTNQIDLAVTTERTNWNSGGKIIKIGFSICERAISLKV